MRSQPSATYNVFWVAGASQVGTAFMMLFFATLGASSGSLPSLTTCWPLMAYIMVMVAVHWAVLASVGKLVRLPPSVLIIGSNANIGGPATAAGGVGGLMVWAYDPG